MNFPCWDDFIKRVLAHVRFKYDHYEIKRELLEHMEDMFCEYTRDGMEESAAEKAVVNCMGDADDIGRALDESHNPALGRLWRISRIVLIILILLNIIPAINLILISGYSLANGYDNKYAERENTELVYRIDVDDSWTINNKHFWIKELRYYDNRVMEVRYAIFENPFSDSVKRNFGLGWFCDDKGNKYYGQGSLSSGYYARGQSFLEDFPPDAESLVYDHDYGGRRVYIEIPLNGEKEEGQ